MEPLKTSDVEYISGNFDAGFTVPQAARTSSSASEAPEHTWEQVDEGFYTVKFDETTSRPAPAAIYETFAVDFVQSDLKVTSTVHRVNFKEGDKQETIAGIPSVFIMNWVLPMYDPPNPLWGSDRTNGPGYNILVYGRLTNTMRVHLQQAVDAGFDISLWAASVGASDAEVKAAAAEEALLMYPNLPEPANPNSLGSAIGSLFSWGGGDAKAKAQEEAKEAHDKWKNIQSIRERRRAEYAEAYEAKARASPPAALPPALALLHRVVHGKRSVYNPANRAVNLLNPDARRPLVQNGVEVLHRGEEGDDEREADAEAAVVAKEDALRAAEAQWASLKMRIITRICNLDACNFNAVVRPLAEKYNGCPYLVTECTRLSHAQGVFEMGIDVHCFSYLSKLGLAGCRDILTVIVFDIILALQGSTASELPEMLLLAVRINRLRLTGAPNITSEQDRQLHAMMSPTSPSVTSD